MTERLVDRLRHTYERGHPLGRKVVNPDGPEAANVIEKLEAEAAFLCARLREFECSILDDAVGNDYYGHVAPSRARLEAILSSGQIRPTADTQNRQELSDPDDIRTNPAGGAA